MLPGPPVPSSSALVALPPSSPLIPSPERPMPEDGSTIGPPASSSDDSAASRSGRSSARFQDEAKVRLSIDLVAAARWHLAFLKSLSDSFFLHRTAAILESIRRYRELWMPLIDDLSKDSSTVPLILPPLDVRWMWHCHCLQPARYREYCASRFGRLLERPAIFDDGNEEYATNRCREIWAALYPSEPFDLEIAPEDEEDEDAASPSRGGEIFAASCKFRELNSLFSDPFTSETVYLVSARQKYTNFLHLCRKHADQGLRMVPTSEVLLMWLTHQSFPGIYARDMEGFWGATELESRVLGFGEKAGHGEVEDTMRIWEQAFDEPYERAGACFDLTDLPLRECFYWDCRSSLMAAGNSESNRKYRALLPRSLMEVRVFLRGRWGETEGNGDGKMFFRLRTVRCRREMKLERPVPDSSSSSVSWEKAWDLCCEFSTRGLILELRRKAGGCFAKSKSIRSLVFSWNELLRAPSLAVSRQVGAQMKAMVSVTPPVQAPFLLKLVPDRVTDNKGSMISDEILRMNQYHPQAGRWLTRTVLDCYGRECFVVRYRVAEGIWRRGDETPMAVKREERIIEVREGPWTYLASSVGTAPQNIVGTAEPKEQDMEEKKAVWALSSGDLLTIRWQRGLEFELETENPIRIEVGRKLHFQVKKVFPDEEAGRREEEEFVTFVRFSPEFPAGRATALFNWRLLAVEFLPEEDAVFVLLVCMAVVCAVTEMKMEDVGHLLVRRRVKEAMAATREWGSVMLHPGSSSSSSLRRPWFWNPREVFSSAVMEEAARPVFRYSLADGKEAMYRQAIALSKETEARRR